MTRTYGADDDVLCPINRQMFRKLRFQMIDDNRRGRTRAARLPRVLSERVRGLATEAVVLRGPERVQITITLRTAMDIEPLV
jgi:hypothetical protein